MKHLREALKCNGYPDWILHHLRDDNINEGEVKRSQELKETSYKERNKKIPVVIPYIKGFSEQIRRVLGIYAIPTYFKPTNTLRELLVKPKDPVSKENVVAPVYKIKYEECDATYVGETERFLKLIQRTSETQFHHLGGCKAYSHGTTGAYSGTG